MQPAASGRGKPMMNNTTHMMMSYNAWTTTVILKYYSFWIGCILRQLPQYISSRARGDINIMGQCSAVSGGAGEGVLL